MYSAIVFLPLASAIILGLFGRVLGDKASGLLSSVLVLAAAVLSWIAFYYVGFEGQTARVAEPGLAAGRRLRRRRRSLAHKSSFTLRRAGAPDPTIGGVDAPTPPRGAPPL